MARFFNTAGPCRPELHYMLPPERRLPGVRQLIDAETYFVIHAARQVGKTTCFRTLAQQLTAEGRYVALHTSCERGQAVGGDVDAGVQLVCEALDANARINLPESLRPPPIDTTVSAGSRLHEMLLGWSQRAPRPVVVFFDEIDALHDEVLVSVLRQLRDGYVSRPDHFPQSAALIGLHDVRDYKASLRPELDTLGTASPFNIKVESLTIRDFTEPEVAELYQQHTDDTGQVFSPEALARAFELTQGQPWLVNALARELTLRLVPDRGQAVTATDVERARELLIQRRDTHLDSLVDRLREPRVRRVIEPILAGELVLGERLDDDISFVQDLGLVARGPGHLRIANPIYQEAIPRALAWATQKTVPYETRWYVDDEGRLRFDAMMEAFVEFWMEHGEALLAAQPYAEVAGQLVLMAFLQRVVNGGGTIDREYAVGRGRMDLCVRWPHGDGEQRFALELKVWRTRHKTNPVTRGLDQLSQYLERLGLDRGWLVVFDQRDEAPELTERVSREQLEHDGRTIELLRL